MNKQNFSYLYEKQKSFTDKLFKEKFNLEVGKFTDEEKIKWTKEYILCASKELYEMLDEIPWKTHRMIKQNENSDNFLEEGIDAFKFLLNIFIVNGYSIDEIIDKFIDKSKVVEIRYEQEKKIKQLKASNEPIAVFDIDGVLNDYPQNFIDFCEKQGFAIDDINNFKLNDYSNYKKLKHRFRAEGHEGSCGIKELSKQILLETNKKYKILLLTARPYEKYSRLFSDTIKWCEQHELPVDFVYFSKDKEKWLIDNFKKEQIKLIVDDQIDNVTELIKYFDNVYLLKNNVLYNEDDFSAVNNKVKIINSLNEINVK